MSKLQLYRRLGSPLGVAAGVLAGTLLLGTQVANLQAAEQEKPKGWESSAAAGLSLTKGNSESFLATLTLNTARKWERDEVLLGAAAGYGEDKTSGTRTKTQDLLSGYGQWNRLFSQRLYGGVRLDALHDAVADIEYRFNLSPLLGYYLIKEKRTTLSAEAGPSFLYEKRGTDTRGYMGLRFAERFEHKFSDRARVWQSAEYIPQVDDFNNYLVNAELGVDTKITEAVSLRLVLQDNYVNQPAPGRRSNDVKLIAGVAYSF